MNLRGLRYFLAVAKLKHFGRAAELCCVSQPSLSAQIKKLEEELDVQLLERTNKKVLLTAVGQDIAQSSQRIFLEIDGIKEIAKNANDPLSSKFTLGAFPTLATYIFPALVNEIHKKMSNLKLVLVEEKTDVLLKKLKAGEIDAALLALPIKDDQLQAKTLFNDEFFLAVPNSHDYSDRKSISIKDLEGQKLMLLDEGHCFRDQALSFCEQRGIDEEEEFRATSMETLRLMVQSGTGITLIPNIARRKSDIGISYISFENICPYRTIGLVWRKTSSRRIVTEKIITIINQLNDRVEDSVNLI